jgi:hypothetical protein
MESIEDIIRRIVRDELERSKLKQRDAVNEPPAARSEVTFTAHVLTPKLAAEKIGVAVKTLANWRSSHRGGETVGPPFIMMGRSPTYERDIDEWLGKQGA